jgi:hypothetical protein
LSHPWALLALLAGTAVLYLWNLSVSGWANSFYSAAAQTGSQSTDPAPAPDQFLRLALGKHIHYFIITNPVQQDKWCHLDLTQ